MSIIITGDFFPGRDMAPYNPFSDKIIEVFKKHEYVMINLEAPLTERGSPISKTGPNLRMHPGFAKILKDSGVDCVCLANNHIRDFGDLGMEDTIKFCKEAGLDIVGGGMNADQAAIPLIKEICSQRVAFLNYCEREFSIAGCDRAGANPFDIIDAYNDIIRLKNKVDRIILIYHGGLEHQNMPTPEMVKAFRFLIEAGADAIASHHMHMYSGYELHKDKPIYYGLGNFFFKLDRKHLDGWYKGLLSDIELNKNNINVKLHSVITDPHFELVDFAEEPMKEQVSQHICTINKVINDGNSFAKYWDKQYSDLREKTLRIYCYRSRNLGRLAKIFRIKTRLSQYRLNIILNTVRCETHRAKMEAILEQYYNEQVIEA